MDQGLLDHGSASNLEVAAFDLAPGLPEPRVLRFDTRSIYVALARERETGDITWEQVASECGVENAAILTRLSKGGRSMYRNVARILTWLGPPASRFVRTVTP